MILHTSPFHLEFTHFSTSYVPNAPCTVSVRVGGGIAAYNHSTVNPIEQTFARGRDTDHRQNNNNHCDTSQLPVRTEFP